MWIGFGVYAIFDKLRSKLSAKVLAPAITVVCLLCVPVLMASENWNDHDRSGRDTAFTMAKMYLDSVDKNGIIFTIGDNDTFALWYVQQVEKYRTDVRIVNTSLLATDWYIDQMKRKAFDSDAVPSQLTNDFYNGKNEAILLREVTDDTIPIKTWMNYIQNDDPRTKVEMQSGSMLSTFPSKYIRIPVNKETVLKNRIVDPKDADKIVDHIDVTIDDRVLYINRLIMFDIIANNNWERPIYFTGGSFGDDDYLWMKDYLELDGMAYKLVPIRTPIDPRNPFDMGRIDTEMYNIVKKWDWGNMSSPDIYHDPETRKNSISYRSNLARLTENLINEGDTIHAKEILDMGMEQMPVDYFEYYTLLEPFIKGYYEVNEHQKARELWDQVAEKYQENLKFYSGWKVDRQYNYADDIITDMERYRALLDMMARYEDAETIRRKADEFNSYIKLFSHFYRDDEQFDTEDNLPEQTPEMQGIDGSPTAVPIDSLDMDSVDQP